MCKKKVLNFLFSHNTGNWTQDVMTELYVQPNIVVFLNFRIVIKKINFFIYSLYFWSKNAYYCFGIMHKCVFPKYVLTLPVG